jgi:hypothetical protein
LTPSVPEPLEPEIVQHRHQENRELFIGIVSALCADNSPRNRSLIFGAAGLGDYQMAPQEATFATQTPNILWKMFSAGYLEDKLYAERPKGRKVPGYHTGNILCLSYVTQPFAPPRIGEPGVILSPPDAALFGETFHVFVDPSMGEKKTELRYCGLYTSVHGPLGVHFDEWNRLPEQVSSLHMLIWRLRTKKLFSVPP